MSSYNFPLPRWALRGVADSSVRCGPDKPSAAGFERCAAVLVLVMLLTIAPAHDLQLDALRKMASYRGDETSTFSEAQTYLNGLRDALIPLALPLGAIGLTGGGVAYMMGNVMAQKILGGVVIGLALTLMAPTLVA